MNIDYNKEYSIQEIFQFPVGTEIITNFAEEKQYLKISSDAGVKVVILNNGETCNLSEVWLNAKYKLSKPKTDWSKVEVDTKILVSEDNESWYNRHFAKYKNGIIYAWADGMTSFTVSKYSILTSWEFAKLYEEER